MSNNKNKAIQYMKILQEYDQTDSLYDANAYPKQPMEENVQAASDPASAQRGSGSSKLNSSIVHKNGYDSTYSYRNVERYKFQRTETINNAVHPTDVVTNNDILDTVDPTSNFSNNRNSYQQRSQQGGDNSSDPVWYRAMIHDAWDVVAKTIETSEKVMSNARDTMETLGTTVNTNLENIRRLREEQRLRPKIGLPQCTAIVDEGNAEGQFSVPESPRMKPAVSRYHMPEIRQPREDERPTKRRDPEERTPNDMKRDAVEIVEAVTTEIKKEKKERAAKKRAARAKKKGGLTKKGGENGDTSASESTSCQSRIPSNKITTKEPPGVRNDPPGAPAVEVKDETLKRKEKSRRRKHKEADKQRHPLSQPALPGLASPTKQASSILRYDLEDPASSRNNRWELGLSDCACAHPTAAQQSRYISPPPLRPCDIPRGSEIRQQQQSFFPMGTTELISNALKPFGF